MSQEDVARTDRIYLSEDILPDAYTTRTQYHGEYITRTQYHGEYTTRTQYHGDYTTRTQYHGEYTTRAEYSDRKIHLEYRLP